MNIEAFISSPGIIQIHVIAATIGFLIGTIVILMPKGVFPHQLLGKLFVFMAISTALTSFFIHHIKQIGPFSWIHILSIITLVSTVKAIRAIRRGDVRTHKQNMLAVYIGGFIIAGAFTFIPGRLMHAIFFGS